MEDSEHIIELQEEIERLRGMIQEWSELARSVMQERNRIIEENAIFQATFKKAATMIGEAALEQDGLRLRLAMAKDLLRRVREQEEVESYTDLGWTIQAFLDHDASLTHEEPVP